MINKGFVVYYKNFLQNNDLLLVLEEEGGYVYYQEKVEGRKICQCSESFNDYFFQVKMFWNSMFFVEKEYIIFVFCFEVGKVNSKDVQQQVVNVFSYVDVEFVECVVKGIGVNLLLKDCEFDEIFIFLVLSQENMVKIAVIRQVVVLVDYGFVDEEVK